MFSLHDFLVLRRARKAYKALRGEFRLYEDVLGAEARAAIAERFDDLAQAIRTREIDDLDAVVNTLREEMRAVLPRPRFPLAAEWFDVLVSALAVAFCFRAYYYEPFRIPTGSMQPTLYGIHAEDAPGPSAWDKGPLRLLKWCVTGETYQEVRVRNPGVVSQYLPSAKPGYVSLIVNGREQFVMQPGDSLHAVIRYGQDGRPEQVEISGTERAVRQNTLRRDIRDIQLAMRYKTQLLACIAIDTKPADRFRDSHTFMDKVNKLIALEEDGCSPEFLNYLRAEYEGIVYGSYVEYPPLYADTRHVPIEKQGIGDYWTVVDGYQPRSDKASLRCMPYSEFLVLYCFYQRTKEAHAAGKTYTRPRQLEDLYKEIVSFYDGNQRDAILFLIMSNYIRTGMEIEKIDPYLKEYKEKYNLDKEYVAILESLLQ